VFNEEEVGSMVQLFVEAQAEAVAIPVVATLTLAFELFLPLTKS
jgi:hypothetical protein